jgi:hypothetical protein
MALSPVLRRLIKESRKKQMAVFIGREAVTICKRAERAQQKADELHQVAALLFAEADRLDPPTDEREAA